MADTEETAPQLRMEDGEYPLHEFHLALAGREWTVLHTGVILTYEDEQRFLRELRKSLPYGVALWPAAIALAHELAERRDDLRGKSVLELGAGTGLPGIVAASLGARVVQTDRQDLAMTICRRNAQKNGIEGIDYRLVEWDDWRDRERYDYIIGSDILYNEPMHEHLRNIFATSLAPGGRLLLSDPMRGVSLKLLESMQEAGWRVAFTKWNLGDPDRLRTVGVYEAQRDG